MIASKLCISLCMAYLDRDRSCEMRLISLSLMRSSLFNFLTRYQCQSRWKRAVCSLAMLILVLRQCWLYWSILLSYSFSAMSCQLCSKMRSTFCQRSQICFCWSAFRFMVEYQLIGDWLCWQLIVSQFYLRSEQGDWQYLLLEFIWLLPLILNYIKIEDGCIIGNHYGNHIRNSLRNHIGHYIILQTYLNHIQNIQIVMLEVGVGIGSLLATAALMLYDSLNAKKQREDQQLKNKQNKHKSIKLLLTGGPCGGKSQGINCIYHSFKQIAAPFFIVPEAATIIGTAGLTLDLSQFQPRQIELFQIFLMRLQYNLEEIVESIARNLQKLEKTPVILCDRGLLDGKAYAGDENWAKMLKEIGITQDDILARYKAAIHMVTAAKGAQNYYNYTEEDSSVIDSGGECEGLKVRKEDPQTAKDLDNKLQKCYENHPNHYIISNEFFVKNFDDKKTVLLAQVYQIISQIIKHSDLSDYYKDYQNSIRKNSEENYQQFATEPSPYLIRKRKYQKFMRKNNPISSPRSIAKKLYE